MNQHYVLAAVSSCALSALGAPASASLIDEFSVFGVHSVVIGGHSVILTGDVGSFSSIHMAGGSEVYQDIHSGGTFSTNNGAFVHGNIFTSGNVSLGANTTVGDFPGTGNIDSGGNVAFTGFGVDVLGDITYAGSLINPGVGTFGSAAQGVPVAPDLPLFPMTSIFGSGGPSFTTGGGQTTTLAPGSYGSVQMGGGSTLNLTAGTYFFDSWQFGNGSHLNINLSGGPIHLQFTGNVSLGSGLDMNLVGGNAGDIFAETHGNWTQGGGGEWFGGIFAPNGTIHIGSGGSTNMFAGFMWGLDVDIEHTVMVELEVPRPALALLAVAGLARRRRRA